MTLTTKRPSSTKSKLAAAITGDGEKARLNAEMEKELYKRCQRQALDEGRSVSEITRALWVDYLNTTGK